MQLRCSHCAFFRGIETGDREEYQRAECRKSPPAHPPEFGFPEVYSDWWCGEYQPYKYSDKADKILNKSVEKAHDHGSVQTMWENDPEEEL